MSASARRESLRKIAHRYRSIPGKFGLREHAVAVRVASWSGIYTGDGTETGSWADVTESGGYAPKVRWANDEQVALGGLDKGDVTIGPITPGDGTVGTLLATVSGSAATTGQAFHVRITGPRHPNGALYRVTDVNVERALRYVLVAKPVANVAAPPPPDDP